MKSKLLEPAYKTKDLGEGTFLFTTTPPHELIGTAIEDHRKVFLEFKKRADTERLLLDYHNGNAQVPAKKLIENYRTLRGIIYSALNNAR